MAMTSDEDMETQSLLLFSESLDREIEDDLDREIDEELTEEIKEVSFHDVVILNR